MPTNLPAPPPLPAESDKLSRRPPAIRFSTRTLFHLTTGLALLCGFGTILPAAFSQIVIGALWIVASGWLITGIVFAKGDARAFCIGAAVVATTMWTGVGGRFLGGVGSMLRSSLHSLGAGQQSGLEVWFSHVLLAATAVGNGYLCILARRYFERHN